MPINNSKIINFFKKISKFKNVNSAHFMGIIKKMSEDHSFKIKGTVSTSSKFNLNMSM